MTEYVVGFMFDYLRDNYVLLIEKKRPEWQNGLLNGIGGHIEENETPLQAMIREFFEETGINEDDWEHFATIEQEEKFRVFFFVSFGDIEKAKAITDEIPHVVCIEDLPLIKCISNLRWLIPLVKDKSVKKPVVFTDIQ